MNRLVMLLVIAAVAFAYGLTRAFEPERLTDTFTMDFQADKRAEGQQQHWLSNPPPAETITPADKPAVENRARRELEKFHDAYRETGAPFNALLIETMMVSATLLPSWWQSVLC